MRHQDWPQRLQAAIAYHDRPFTWGESDCMQLAMHCAHVMTGQHPFPDTPGSYFTRAGAYRCLKVHGFDNIAEALAARYQQVAPALAQRGDIGIVSFEGVLSSCVCEGREFVGKAPDKAGLIRVPREKVVQAFRVA